MKSGFVDRDEAIETGFGGRVDRPVFARPVAEALFEAQRVERARAEVPQAEIGTGRDDRVVERELAIRGHPDFVTELAGERDAADVRRKHRDVHRAERRGREAPPPTRRRR